MTSVVFNELLSVNETNITKNREYKTISQIDRMAVKKGES